MTEPTPTNALPRRGATTFADYSRRRGRALVMRACLAVVLGALCTVGASWACALYSRSSSPPLVVIGVFQGDGTIDPNPQTQPVRGLGVRAWMRAETRLSSDAVVGQSIDAVPVETYMAFGWPFPALHYRVVTNKEAPGHLFFEPVTMVFPNNPEPEWLVGGRSGLRGNSWLGLPGRHLPLSPSPLGFIANTLLASVVIWLVAGGWKDVHRVMRLRRGSCVRCGYDMRGLSVCPECGLSAPRSNKPGDTPAMGQPEVSR